MARRASFGVEIVQGEVSLLLSATRRGSRWASHGRNEESQDPLILGLYRLQEQLNHASVLTSLDVSTFITPFCQIVQSDDTTGPVTGMAIASLEKFLSYNLIDPFDTKAPVAIEALSEAVTHARFVGTNPASDEVVLMKILQILRTLLLSPAGCLLTNESVCEIMQSCFRICFEMRLSELLRCFGENTLVDLVQLLFTRLAGFSDDLQDRDNASSMDQTLVTPNQETPPPTVSTTVTSDVTSDDGAATENATPASQAEESAESLELTDQSVDEGVVLEEGKTGDEEKVKDLTPYGLPCVKELLRFLVSIISTEEGHANSDALVAIGLNLVTVALECGSTHLCSFPGLALLVQDSLCKYLFQLLRHDSFVLFSRALRCCCLLFQSCRPFLKLQLEVFMNRLMELITVDGASKNVYDKRELALETIVQLCNTSHFPAELYVNFDCGLYCSNVFENLTKLLSKNAFPTQGAIFSTHLLSLDALLAIANNLETDGHVTLSVALEEGGRGHKEPSDQVNSAGIIFSSQAMQDDELPLAARSISLPQMKHISLSHDVIGGAAVNSNKGKSLLSKPASGYQLGVGTEGVGIVVGEDGGGGEEEAGEREETPSSKDLLKVRQKKKLILAATEQFNKKPKQGILFLQEQGVLATPLDPAQVARFLRDNPGLSKAKIGDYIGEKKNGAVLETFVSTFVLRDVPMVDALRDFLESFRLPGESPIVERILEVFSQHWLDCNTAGEERLGEQFANRDSVHVLSYAIMMLNTDLHSSQVKKKMTLKEFIRNQRKTNNGKNFPEPFLTEVYNRIKEEEIIMPDEHSGHVRENYQWKVMLHRSTSHEGSFMGVASGEFDQDLFLLSWGPTIAALSFVYDHADDKSIAQKTITGFSKCASVAAHYELKEVFDNLIISLCKFTTLLNNHENTSSMYYSLGVNPKVKQSVQTMFSLAHGYGNILREGWKDLLDCLLALFKARLLPQQMVEGFDFLHPEGKVSLFREDQAPTRTDSSLLSSLYSYWASSASQDSGLAQSSASSSSGSAGAGGGAGGRSLSTSEGKAKSAAVECIQECHPEQLFTESKFLRSDALTELVKALVFASRGPDQHQSLGTHFDEDAAVFFLELLVTVAIENKDRVSLFWKDLSSHLSRVISSATASHFLLERGVVAILHLALRLLGRGDFPIIKALTSLHTLLSLPPPTPSPSSSLSSSPPSSSSRAPSLTSLYRQIAHGLTDLAHTHSTTIHTSQQWLVVFTLLEFAGTGLTSFVTRGGGSGSTEGSQSDLAISMATTDGGSRDVQEGKASSGEEEGRKGRGRSRVQLELRWKPGMDPSHFEVVDIVNAFDTLEGFVASAHDSQAFFKVCECLSFLVRSDHMINSENFVMCVQCTRHFTEVASSKFALNYDQLHTRPGRSPAGSGRRERGTSGPSSPSRSNQGGRGGADGAGGAAGAKKLGGGVSDTDTTYASCLLQLLDLLDSLYSKVGRIFDTKAVSKLKAAMRSQNREKNEHSGQKEAYCPDADGVCPRLSDDGPGLMWTLAWCPLLQGMARMCCDSRRSVRQTAITYLQRALLSHDLHNLTRQDWHACFADVFFPMLTRLLGEIQTPDRQNLEETRVRASNLLCKVFLQHLPSLSQMKDSFTELWMTILYFMEKFLLLENSDLLYEAIPESLKNMLLVMSTQGVFDNTATPTLHRLPDSSLRTAQQDSTSKTLWLSTWNRIDQFLPNFLSELFPTERFPPSSSQILMGAASNGGGGTSAEGAAQGQEAKQEVKPEVVEESTEVEMEKKEGHVPSASVSPALMVPGKREGYSHSPRESPSHSLSASPLGSSSPDSSAIEIERSPPFPITLHPPLPPTLSPPQNLQATPPAPITSVLPIPTQIQSNTESRKTDSASPTNSNGLTNSSSSVPLPVIAAPGPNSIQRMASPDLMTSSQAPSANIGMSQVSVSKSTQDGQVSSSIMNQRVMQGPIPVLGAAPILGPPAPPYSETSSKDSDLASDSAVQQLSSVYSL